MCQGCKTAYISNVLGGSPPTHRGLGGGGKRRAFRKEGPSETETRMSS